MSSIARTTSNQSTPDDLYQEVYQELRQLAHAKMSKEFAYSTLQGTALVHEAWLRMGGEKQPSWTNRAHFFGAAAEAMRRILVDRARKRLSQKRGGDLQRVNSDSLNELRGDLPVDDQLLQVNEALERLQEIDPQKAELVKLRYFFGMSFEQAAETLDISVSTAKRWWLFARSWLHREITSEK